MGLRARLDAALTRLGVGEHLSLDCLDGNCDACDTCSHKCGHAADHVRRALALHPAVTLPSAWYPRGGGRVICGLCRDPYPCATVKALS